MSTTTTLNDVSISPPVTSEGKAKYLAGKEEVSSAEATSGLEATTQLPASAKTNADGVPTFMGLHGDRLITGVTVIATFGFLLFGYDQGVMAGIINAPQFVADFPACDPLVQGEYQASVLQATYVSIYELGCLAGAVFALFCGNRLGRRKMIMTGACIMIVGTILQVSAVPGHAIAWQFLIGRVVTGVGNGMNTATIPSWVAETSKSHNRGLLVCIEASTIAIGTAISYWVDYGLSYVPSSVSWRVPIGLQVAFAVILFAGVLVLPESPRWLLHQGRHVDAQHVIAALAGDTYSSEKTRTQTRVIMQAIEQSERVSSSKKATLFTNGPTQHLRRMLLGVSSQVIQQFGGCNAIIYFVPIVFQQNLGLDRNLALILGGVNVTVYAISAMGSYGIIERVGRRKMFLWGSAGQGVSMVIAWACLLPGDSQSAKGSVFGLFLFLVFFGATLLELPWLFPAEANPLATRSAANAASTIANWLTNFAVIQFTPPMLSSIGGWTFFFFAVLNFSFIPFIYFYYIETAGRSLEEIDLIFAKGYGSDESYVKTAATMPHMAPQEVIDETNRVHLDHQASVEAANDAREDLVQDGSSTPASTRAGSSHEEKTGKDVV